MINEKYKSEYQEKFAFIIGINNYKNTNSLEYAENDAKSIKDILINEYDYKQENITLLLGKDATKENILNYYSKYINKTCHNDSLIFYYAGHGETYMGIQGNEGFLVPYDGTQENWNTLIGWKEIIEKGNLIKAKHIFYVIDACYSGLVLSRGPAFASSRFLTDILSRPARQVLTAGKGDQKVADAKGPIANHSLFTGYFIKGIQGEAAQENGIITANMLMAYVSNKVGNDSNSFQTPQAGEIFGDGDFVFRGSDNQQSSTDDEKNEEQLVRIPSPNDDYLDLSKSKINEFKELLSDSKNRIKINEMVNSEIKETISKLMLISKFPNTYDDKVLKDVVLKYNQSVNLLMQMLVLLIYYGDNLYDSLIKKILDKLANVKSTNGIELYVNLQYYPCLIAFYISIMTCIESDNIKLLKEILNMDKDIGVNRYIDTDNLLVNVSSNITKISSYFKIFFDKNYRYPFSEYLYAHLQPELDDLLFLGEGYEKDFVNAEMLISVINALVRYEYDYDERVWGTSGRFNYKIPILNKNIKNMEIYSVIEKLDLLNNLKDKKDTFINAYNKFLSNRYF